MSKTLVRDALLDEEFVLLMSLIDVHNFRISHRVIVRCETGRGYRLARLMRKLRYGEFRGSRELSTIELNSRD